MKFVIMRPGVPCGVLRSRLNLIATQLLWSVQFRFAGIYKLAYHSTYIHV